MNKKNISPNPQKPVNRQTTGQLPDALAELNEEALSSTVNPSGFLDGLKAFGKALTCLW